MVSNMHHIDREINSMLDDINYIKLSIYDYSLFIDKYTFF